MDTCCSAVRTYVLRFYNVIYLKVYILKSLLHNSRQNFTDSELIKSWKKFLFLRILWVSSWLIVCQISSEPTNVAHADCIITDINNEKRGESGYIIILSVVVRILGHCFRLSFLSKYRAFWAKMQNRKFRWTHARVNLCISHAFFSMPYYFTFFFCIFLTKVFLHLVAFFLLRAFQIGIRHLRIV